MTQEELNQIAQTLRLAIETTEGKPVQHKHDSGLTITLQADLSYGIWTLSLTKLYRQASEKERQMCKKAFRVPRGHDWTPTYREGYGIIRYTWRVEKLEQLTFPETIA